MTSFIERATALSPIKQKLLQRLLLGMNPVAPAVIPCLVDRNNAPLSFAQKRLWILDQLEPDSAFYNIAVAVRLQGVLDEICLEKAINEVARRQTLLQATFDLVDQQTRQQLHPERYFPLPLVDLRLFPAPGREAEARRILAEKSREPFNLEQGPLFRALLLRLDPQEHLLFFLFHHIIFDGWSEGLFVEEVSAFYGAFLTGHPASLPELPIQYQDFAAWQHHWLQGEVLDRQLRYWTSQLADAPPVLELPADRPRPGVQSFRGAQQQFAIPASLAEGVREVSRAQGVTLFVTLLAAFKVLLHRYTGEVDLSVGTPIANRNREEIERLIGCFVNTLVLRSDLSHNPTVATLLKQIQALALDAYNHQDLPFERLVEELRPERSLSHAPLFQVMFVLQNAPMPALHLPHLTLSLLDLDTQTARFDLVFSVREQPQGMTLTVEYSTDLFDPSTIERMVRHYQRVLAAISADPTVRVGALPLLTDEEQAQLAAWNAGGASYPQEETLHVRFEAQAARHPEAIALTYEGESVRYGELNARANRLAHHLRSLGVGAEGRVGLYLERSIDLVVAILAVLKAGGVYVPLDPAYPRERLAFVLNDAGAMLLLTQSSLEASVPESAARVLYLDREQAAWDTQPSTNPTSGAGVVNGAYVIYTSGSTGQPKGVLIPHANVGRLLDATQGWFNFDESDVWTLFHSYAFDFSVWELWGALLYGGRLVVVPYLVSRNPHAFYELLCREQITVLNQTPSAFRQLIQAEEETSAAALPPLSLRYVIFGGEALELQSLRPWVARHRDEQPRLVNMYGITETTVHVTYRPLTQADLAGSASVIGEAIPDLSLLILDAQGQRVPVGVPGELHVGGAGLARGYLNRPALTAERFIPDPFSNAPGARLYRTGDLARYLPTGDIEYLGRLDEQVKIRGFRIELGEIEAALTAHPAVREALVLAHEGDQGKRLVAYLVLESATSTSAEELRVSLKETLPEYMVPAFFVLLEAMPLTANGKINRRALPTPEQALAVRGGEVELPRTEVEERLAAIWSEILGVAQVGVHDNFFTLGGDSILAIQVIARASREGLHFTPKQLFQYQTIAELASVAGTSTILQAEQGLVTGEIPLTPIQQWFFEQPPDNPHHFNQAVLLELTRPLDPTRLEQALARLLEHHDALRLRFEPREGQWQQVSIAPDGPPPLTRVDLTTLPPTEQQVAFEQAAGELQASLHLTEGPLLRVGLFDFGPSRRSRLLLVIHHLAVDGVSWRILLEDLEMLYTQPEQPLPPKTISFKQWAEQLTCYARSEALRREYDDFWAALAPRAMLSFPTDFPEGDNRRGSVERVTVCLDSQETSALLQDVPPVYQTQVNDVLLTALVQACASWSGSARLLVELEGHGREEIVEGLDLSRTVGWFTAIFPVLLDLEHVLAPGEALKAIKEQLRAVPNKGIGYGVLRYLSDGASLREGLRAIPQPEISFNYLGQLDRTLAASAPFRPIQEPIGPLHSPEGARRHLIEIDSFIVDGQLRLEWQYSRTLHQRATIERLAEAYLVALRALIAHCQSDDAGGYTPSDFSKMQFSQDELDDLLADLSDF